MLKPLNEFICDRCGVIIERPEDGCVEWLNGIDERGKPFAKGFKIVHSSHASPLKGMLGCYHHAMSGQGNDLPLDVFMKYTHQQLFSFLSLGPILDPEGISRSQISDYNEFADFFRRLTIPYYEEARHYFVEASQDSEFLEKNEITVFSEDTLKSIIEQYG